jgi:peptide/nickel transport system substrate-binding protein
MTFALQVSLAPVWFDPADTTSTSVPFIVLYAVHDALVKAMPGQPMAPSLAESWTVSRDGLVYEFVLRKGVRFHNGEPVTAEDAKFSFERYRGTAASAFKSRIAAVEVENQRVRFRLKQPWPDFMTYYGTPATGAGWVVPKKYLERVGDEGSSERRSGRGRTSSSRSTRGSSLCSRPTSSIGARRRASRRWCFARSPTRPRDWPC